VAVIPKYGLITKAMMTKMMATAVTGSFKMGTHKVKAKRYAPYH